MGDASRELAERSQILGLNETVLGGTQVIERSDNSRVRCCTSLEQLDVVNRNDRLVRKGLQKLDVMFGEQAGLNPGHGNQADQRPAAQQRHKLHAAKTTQPRHVTHAFRFEFGIDNPNKLSLAYRFAPAETRKWSRECGLQGRVGIRVGRGERPQVHHAVVKSENRGRKPPISRFDRSAMASNTGCTSDGELAITFRMSAVAVCRSSASWSR